MKDHNFGETLVSYGKMLILAILLFYIFSFLFFALVFWCYFGYNENMLLSLKSFLINILQNPAEILPSFSICFRLLKDCTTYEMYAVFALLVLIFSFYYFYVKAFGNSLINKSYQRAFATEKAVRQARLFSGNFHFLGTAFRQPLSLPFNSSVLVFTSKNKLKTYTLAIPSIVQNDDCSIVAIDTENILQKMTEGYRQTLGKSLCFNWDDENKPEQNQYIASWNPLADKMIPSAPEKRDRYISRLATALMCAEKPADEYSILCMQCLLEFFIAKTKKAAANDYFLNLVTHNTPLSDEDKDILMNYYLLMPDELTSEATTAISINRLTLENYVPVGSWENISERWQGKDLSLAMIYDSLIRNNAKIRSSSKAKTEASAVLFKQYAAEAELFNYPDTIKNILLSIAKKEPEEQTRIFNEVISSLSIFKKQSIREKTVISDFSYDELRGLNVDDGIYPTSIYLAARNEDEKGISKIMLHILITETIENYENQSPVVFVIDDADKLGYIHALSSGMNFSEKANISFIILSNNNSAFKNFYDEKTYKNIINNSDFIMISSDDPEKEKKLLLETANSKTKPYLDELFSSIDRLAVDGDDNALLIANRDNPLFIQVKLLPVTDINQFAEASSIPTSPYIDDFVRDQRPTLSSSMVVPAFEELPKEKEKRKVGRPRKNSDDQWWMNEQSFATKKADE